MIPAILSAVFVIYLYQTVNQPPIEASDESAGPVDVKVRSQASGSAYPDIADQATVQDLSARLLSMQSRIEQLAGQLNQKGGKP